MKSMIACCVAVMAFSFAPVLAQAGGGGGGGSSGGYGGCPPPAASPAPAPAPAPSPSPGPSPSPSPSPGPGGGTSPGPGGGGTTPGAGGGGSTPGAGGGAGGPGAPGGAGGGYGGSGRGARATKSKFSNEQAFWLGAVTLPWKGAFLPKASSAGYEGAELTIEQAVADRQAAEQWKTSTLPTIVCVYDPSDRRHVKSLGQVSADKQFKTASHYCNLVRIDVRTINNKKLRRKLAKTPTFFVFRANGEKMATVKKPANGKPFIKPMNKVFEADFGHSLDAAVARMGAVIARRAWVKDEIKRHNDVLYDPVSGELMKPIQARIIEYKKELKDLKLHESILKRLKKGALASASK